MMFNNRNMQKGILEINVKSIITTLNKLTYMSDSRHLIRRDVLITFKLHKAKDGPEITSTLRKNKHPGIEIQKMVLLFP